MTFAVALLAALFPAASRAASLYSVTFLDDQLITIDPTNGATTLIGNTAVDVGSQTGELTFGPGGSLYASLDVKLYTLDPTTGVATAAGSADPLDTTGFSSISGLAFGPTVPEPSSVLLLGLGVAVASVAALRRR